MLIDVVGDVWDIYNSLRLVYTNELYAIGILTEASILKGASIQGRGVEKVKDIRFLP